MTKPLSNVTLARTHGVERNVRQVLVCFGFVVLCAVLFFGARTAEGASKASSWLQIENPWETLFANGAGNRSVTVTANGNRINSLRVEVSPVGAAGGSKADGPLASVTKAVSANGKATFDVNLPHLGLYDLKVVAMDGDHKTIKHSLVRMAALGPQSSTPIADIGVSAHLARDSQHVSQALKLVRLAGFGRIRDGISWNRVEPKPGQFKFPLVYDEYFTQTNELGIQPLIILGYVNTHAYDHLAARKTKFLATGRPMDLFQEYVRAVVNRYGDRIHAWELWNEPKFNRKNVAKRYADLLKKTHKTLNEVAPSAELIACGGAGVGGGPNGECFLKMLRYGAGKAMDGYSIHPYMGSHNPPESGYAARKSVIPRVSVPVVWRYNQKLIDKHRHQTKKYLSLWVTELGWFTRSKSHPASEIKQAAYFDQLYLLTRKYSQAKAVFWYDFRDDGENPKDKEDNFGLVTHRYEPKPSYVAAATLTRTLGDREWMQSLRSLENKPGQKIEQYGEGDNTVVAAWANSDAGPARVRVANGKYMIRHWDGQETVVHARSQTIRLNLGPLPVFVYRVSG